MTTIVDADGKPFEPGIYELIETVKNPSADKRYRHTWVYYPEIEKGRRFECRIVPGLEGSVGIMPIGFQSEIRFHVKTDRFYGEASESLSRAVVTKLRKSAPQSVYEVLPNEEPNYGEVINQLVKDGKITFADVKGAFDRWYATVEE